MDEIRAAAQRIAGIAVKTPLVRAPFPGTSGEIWLKAESLQPIGSFKLRGALNKILQLSREEIARGVITYSSGNHAQGVAYAAREVGAKAVIVMPSNAPSIKRAATLALGAEVVDVGVASSERLAKCEELVREHGYVVVPPYDDEEIIAGQGTCGLEIVEALPDVDLVLSPVSGGGLLSGVATAVKLLRPEAKVFGIEPELAGDSAESFRTGKMVTWRGGADQPDDLRWFAHAERGGTEFRAYPEVRGRNCDRDGGGDSRGHAGDRGCDPAGSGAERGSHHGGAHVPCGGIATVPQGSSHPERRQRGPEAAGRGADGIEPPGTGPKRYIRIMAGEHRMSIAWQVFYYLWIAGEIVVAVATRRGTGSRDRGTQLVLWVVIVCSLTLAGILKASLPVAFPWHSHWLGFLALILLIFGIGIRMAAILTLGRWFTANVAIDPRQTIQRSGLYGIVRHPSYLGMEIIFLAIGLHSAAWPAMLAAFFPPTLAVLYRIRVEESALKGAFGAEYAEYCQSTKRLVPGVY